MTRRSALRLLAGFLTVSLCSACSAPIFSHAPVLRARPKLTLLAAHPGSSAIKTPEPAWLAPLRAAVDHLNATQQDQLGATLDLHVFSADQAPGSVTLDITGRVKTVNFTAYTNALAAAVTEQADLVVTAEESYFGALSNLDHASVLKILDAYLARERPNQQVAYYPGALALGRISGRQVALPLQVQPWLMRFDAAMFRAVGLTAPGPDKPWTWQQLIDAQSKLVQRSSTTGANLRWACRVESLPVEAPIWQAGGDVVNGQNAVVLDQPAAIQGVTFWRDLETVYHLDASKTFPPSFKRDPARPYALPTYHGGFAATAFQTLAGYGYSPAEIAQHWEEGLGFAPIPAGAPGGDVPVTKLALQLAGAVAVRSRQPELVFSALRALEQALGPALLLSAIRPLAMQRLKDGSLDARLASALGWGMAVGRASGADVLGTAVLIGLDEAFPGTY
ncbi:MAG: ABC transporter substrate-binding protein, partial [Chloroflexota bacterium]